MSIERRSPLDDSQPGAVRPEALAQRIGAMRRLQDDQLQEAVARVPRALEALWHVQWRSMQPGGCTKFAKEFSEFLSPRLGTVTMQKLGRRTYTAEECQQVWSEIPHHYGRELADEIDATYGCESAVASILGSDDWSSDEAGMTRRRRAELCGNPKTAMSRDEALLKLITKRNEPYFRQLCLNAVLRELDGFFEKISQTETRLALWCCPDLLGELVAFMDHHARQVEQRIAHTAVTAKVFDGLEYAHAERVMVRIEGDPRFGKSESVETWAAMWPGRARVVRTPSSNSDKDLIRAVAEALGIHHGPGAGGESLKAKVEFVIRFGGLMLIFDEAQFCLPSNFSASTPPSRLNWIRTAIVDRKVPCVFVVTPQSYRGALARFVKKTGYSIEQFIGREALLVLLPNELAHDDLLAVARIHFPDADEDLLGLVAAMALQSESYLKAVENIARRARYSAAKRGRQKFTLDDVEQAIAEVMPASAPARAVAPVSPIAPKAKLVPARALRRGRAAATVLQAPFRIAAKDFPARETAPLEGSPEAAETLATG